MSKGILRIYTGPMFSGKSSKLIDDAEAAKEPKLIVTSKIGTKENHLYSRDDKTIPAIRMNDSKLLAELLESKDYKNVFIDEGQFFDRGIIKVINEGISKGINFTVAGIRRDVYGNVFGHLKELKDYADEVIFLSSLCNFCGKKANYSARLINGVLDQGDNDIVILKDAGAEIEYIATCREHKTTKQSTTEEFELNN